MSGYNLSENDFVNNFVNNYRKGIWVDQYKNQNLTFWLKFTFFFLALFVSEKLSKNYEMYLTSSQVSVKNFAYTMPHPVDPK
jgi:hypothetical protein